MRGIVVATFNMHAGIDGWGHPYDAVAACDQLDADVLVLQENFGIGDGERDGLAGEIAGRLGYEVRTVEMATARRYPPVEGGRGFGPPFWSHRPVGLRVRGPRRPPGSPDARDAWARGTAGRWGLAVLSRLPVLRDEDVDLGDLPRDPAHRRMVLVDVAAGERRISVAGVHMAHLSHGSIAQFRRLARELPPPGVDAVLAGDMNLWGPPLRLLLPGWRRAVRGRTWPAHRPVAQADHLLVRPGTRVSGAAVVRLGRSDHRAVRAVLELD